MKKSTILLFLSLVSFVGFSQEEEETSADSIPYEYRRQGFIYVTAKQFNDPFVARMALYNLLSLDPGNYPLYDSLALSYFNYNQFASAALVANVSLEINPNNAFTLRLGAASFDRLGAKDKALSLYEKFYLIDNSITVLYELGLLRYELKRFTEANATLDLIIEDPVAEKEVVVFPTVDGTGQEASLVIAAQRVKAMILEEQGDKEGALAKYLEILKLQPGIEIVQKQIQELREKKE